MKINFKISFSCIVFAFVISLFSCREEPIVEPLIKSKTDVNKNTVLFSNDGGKTYIRALLVNGIYYGNVGVGLYYSTNKGVEWTLSNIGTKIDSIWYVSSFYIAQGKDSIYSSNNGQTFTKLNINAKILGITLMGNQVMMLTNKGVFTTTNGQDINPTAVTDSVQAFLTFNNSVLIGTRKGLYQSNGENITLTNVNQSVSSLYKSNKLALAKADSLYFTTNGMVWKPVIKLNNIYFANATDSLYVSNDNVNWRNGNLGAVSTLIYKDNFIETTLNGKKYYSSDGVEWGSGVYLVGVNYNALFYSRDGKNFYKSNNINGNWIPILKFNNIYYSYQWGLIDGSKELPHILYYSYDGINWTKLNLILANDVYHRFHNEYFIFNNKLIIVIDGGVFASSDGINFTKTLNANLSYIKKVNTIIYASGDKTYYSKDGVNWGLINISNRNSNHIPDVFYVNNLFFGGGSVYSENGIDFYQTNLIGGSRQVEYLNGNYVCQTTDNGGYYSTDGKNWVKSNLNYNNHNIYTPILSYFPKRYEFLSIKKLNNTLLCNITIDTTNQLLKSILYYSKDGVNWAETNINLQNWIYIDDFYEVNGRLFLTNKEEYYKYGCSRCSGFMYTSIDGITWIKTNLSSFPSSIMYDSQKNIYLASIGTNKQTNAPSYSLDGINWYSSSGINNHYYTYPITKANNRLYASTASRGVYFSYDGKSYLPTNLTEGSFSQVLYYDE